MRFNIDEKITRFIRLKRSFTFREALIITEASKNYLEASLERLINDGKLKIERSDKSILGRVYRVLKEEEENNKPYNLKLINSVGTVCKQFKKEELESVDFLKLFNIADMDRNSFQRLLDTFDLLGILLTIEKQKSYRVDLSKVDDLLTFLKQKKYKEIQEILDGKRPLRYVEVPEDLPKILNVIIENEVLKRDEVAKFARVTRKRLTDWWKVLKSLGVIIDSFKETPEDRVSYIFNSKRATTVLKHLNNGAYEKDKELRHLWLEN
jgi:hypothetical protein